MPSLVQWPNSVLIMRHRAEKVKPLMEGCEPGAMFSSPASPGLQVLAGRLGRPALPCLGQIAGGVRQPPHHEQGADRRDLAPVQARECAHEHGQTPSPGTPVAGAPWQAAPGVRAQQPVAATPAVDVLPPEAMGE